MEWLRNDVIYGAACALLLTLLVRELLATVATFIPLSRTPHWLPSAVQYVISNAEPIRENVPAAQKDISTQVNEIELHQVEPSLTRVAPRDVAVNNDKVTMVECNGDVSTGTAHERCVSDSLRRRVDTLNAELAKCRQLIANAQQTEQNLRQRLGEQLMEQFERNPTGKFENICLDDNSRPTSLIRRYDNIYTDERVEVLDVLEQNGQGHDLEEGQSDLEQGHTELHVKTGQQPEQLLLSIIVECFEYAQQRVQELTDNLHRSLLMEIGNQQRSTSTAAAADDDDDDVKTQLNNVDDAVFNLLRHAAARRGSSQAVEAVYERLQLHKNNSAVNNSSELCHYVTTCAQLAWSLTAQRPSYALEYQLSGAVFDYSRHQRFHTSDPGSYVVTQVVWPGLVEQSTGVCVSRAVVVT